MPAKIFIQQLMGEDMGALGPETNKTVLISCLHGPKAFPTRAAPLNPEFKFGSRSKLVTMEIKKIN